jgi:aspartate aminotransferase-like enzyme
MAEPPLSHTSPEAAALLLRAINGFREVIGCRTGEVFVIPGSGTAAMEAGVVNCVDPQGTLLVLANGYFGERFAHVARAHGIPVDVVRPVTGRSVTPDELEARLGRGGVRAVAMTHVETSTGVLAPVTELCRVAHAHECLTLVDGVCATAGVEEDMEAMGIDVLVTGSQKAIGMPTGLALLGVGTRGRAARDARDGVPAYYLDVNCWRDSMRDPTRYFATHAMNLVRAFDTAIQLILSEGLASRYARHRRHGDAFRAGIEALDLAPVTDPRYLAPTMSAVRYPPGLNDAAFRSAMKTQGVVVAGGLAELAGLIFRAGHMGNIDDAQVLRLVAAVERSLPGAKPGAGVEATARALHG